MKRFIIVVIGILFISAVHGQIYIEGNLSHDRDVEMGGSYSGTIEVGNTGSEPQAVQVYQTDYSFNARGETYYGDAGSLPRSNGLWISFFPSRFTIPAKKSVAVTYRIEGPAGPELLGTYWSLLMVEGIPPDSPEGGGEVPAEPTIGITQLLRYGIQIVTNIGSTGTPGLEILGAQLVRQEDEILMMVDIINSGERLLIPQVSAEAFNAKGDKHTVTAETTSRLFPGTSARYQLNLTALQSGEYQLLLILDAGEDNVFGANYSIQL